MNKLTSLTLTAILLTPLPTSAPLRLLARPLLRIRYG